MDPTPKSARVRPSWLAVHSSGNHRRARRASDRLRARTIVEKVGRADREELGVRAQKGE